MANKTIQLSDGTNNLYPCIYRTEVHGSQSISSNNTTIVANSISIDTGVWMVIAYVSWGTSSTSPYNINIVWNGLIQRTVRSTMVNGGGAINVVVFAPSTAHPVQLSIWQNSGSAATATYWIDAIKLK